MVGLVRALARYEKLTPPSPAAAKRLTRDIGRRLRALIAHENGRAIGYALYFFAYSSFLARPTLYIEDLFILPGFRRQGAGRKMFEALRRKAEAEGCGRMEWIVLAWNKPALRFYKKLGAERLGGWVPMRLTLAG